MTIMKDKHYMIPLWEVSRAVKFIESDNTVSLPGADRSRNEGLLLNWY